MWAQSRAKRLGVPFNMTTKDFQLLWMRDHANRLERPSIDRIEPKYGYSLHNCRFIERNENSARAQRGRKSTEAQIEAGRRNLTG